MSTIWIIGTPSSSGGIRPPELVVQFVPGRLVRGPHSGAAGDPPEASARGGSAGYGAAAGPSRRGRGDLDRLGTVTGPVLGPVAGGDDRVVFVLRLFRHIGPRRREDLSRRYERCPTADGCAPG
ncbi:hypothetical protein ETD96_43820 [Actinomadura geliboluensis]|uniref:Uncharacterized protein n=1 Tax=Actinomadura geliboluensis TaxID=882440 RepID=A0A5S4FPS9_9ACTN|nr:hypothetical protein ETD96_43820 [Actinomadura geliboluensis]